MRDLILHPHCRPGRITRAAADIRPTAEGCTARFRFEGDIAAIKIPETQEPTRSDELWKSTCFEIFWQPENGTNYREFNLSPSTRWACYEFDDYRSNMRDAPAEVAIDPHLDSRGSIVVVDHPAVGPRRYPSLPWRFDGAPIPPAGPAPLLHRYTAPILEELLGYSVDEIEELVRNDVLT